MRMKAATEVAVCIACGCDDLHACDDGLGGPCGWLVVDRKLRVGVCSSCSSALKRWKRGERQVNVNVRRR